MKLLVLGLGLTSYLMWAACSDDEQNNTHPDKDMYVIHATVYQVGILTNKTDNMTDFNSTGNQESFTLYHSNGSNIDLSAIPEPFLTNVTAKSFVGVAPVPYSNDTQNVAPPMRALHQLTYPVVLPLGTVSVPTDGEEKSSKKIMKRRPLDHFLYHLVKRDTKDNTPVKLVNGAAIIPSEAGVQSIGLPPLLSLNNNLSEIPVPIPNTSVVHYVKVNTLVKSTN